MSFFKLIDLTSFYFTPSNYSNNGYTLTYLYTHGYSITNLYECGYSVYDLSGLYPGYIQGYDLINSIIPTDELIKIMNTTTFPLRPIMQYYLSNPTLLIPIQKLFQIYNITDIYSISSTILQNQGIPISNISVTILIFMKQNKITIRQIYPLINNTQLIPIVSINQLQQSNYTLLDILQLILINPSLYSYSSIYQSLNFKIVDYYNSGISASSMKTIGFINNPNIIQINTATLYSAGYSILDLYNAGYNEADFSNNGFSLSDLILAGLSVAQINTLYNQNIPLDDLIVKYKASLSQIVTAGYSLNEIAHYKITYFSINNYLNVGYTLQQLDNAGFLPIDFYTGTILSGNPSISQILNLGYDASYIIPLDIPILDYYRANYSSLNLFNNGFNINILANNYSLLNFKNDNVPIYQIYLSHLYLSSEFILDGYILSEFYNGGIPVGFITSYYSLTDVINIGYSIESIVVTHYYPAADFFNLHYSSSLLGGYYTIAELLAGGYSKKDLNVDGNNINQYCCLKSKCNECLPTKLGTSFNQNRISKKASYAQSITTRSGGSYTTSYSSYTNTTTPVPPVCPDTFIIKTVIGGAACKSLNIPTKTGAAFSNFIRNYIKQQVYLYNPNANSSELDSINSTALNNIYQLQQSNPNIPIYTTIKNYFYP